MFKTSFEIDQRWLLELAADRTPFIDQAQSLNLFIPADVDKWDLMMLHFRAWELGIKSLYYLRSKSVQRAGFAGGVEADNTPELKEIQLASTHRLRRVPGMPVIDPEDCVRRRAGRAGAGRRRQWPAALLALDAASASSRPSMFSAELAARLRGSRGRRGGSCRGDDACRSSSPAVAAALIALGAWQYRRRVGATVARSRQPGRGAPARHRGRSCVDARRCGLLEYRPSRDDGASASDPALADQPVLAVGWNSGRSPSRRRCRTRSGLDTRALAVVALRCSPPAPRRRRRARSRPPRPASCSACGTASSSRSPGSSRCSSDKVAVYAVPNNGGWYDFGYFLGIVVFGVGARKSRSSTATGVIDVSERSRTRNREHPSPSS